MTPDSPRTPSPSVLASPVQPPGWGRLCIGPLVLGAAGLLAGCDRAPTPTAAAVQTAEPGRPVVRSVFTPLPLKCDESALTEAGAFIAENNVWGKKDMVGWSQCMGLEALPAAPGQPSAVRAQWTWDWKNEGDQVKAFPEIVFGHKPGFPKSSTTQLPRPLSGLRTLSLSYDIQTEREGTGNLSIDMWLTNQAQPTTFAVPPITHEVMIWLEAYGPMYVGGTLVDRVRINDTPYRVHVGEQFGLGWRYIAFAPNSPQPMNQTLNLLPFFDYLRGKGLITPQEHLSAINLGNEIIAGQGETRVHRLSVQVE